ncbi:MAG: hypothetical protein IKU86_00535, partial [Thermoguttaceae bacterium]|nr:hypothetical protein [Thermoguttaceae bacterium]
MLWDNEDGSTIVGRHVGTLPNSIHARGGRGIRVVDGGACSHGAVDGFIAQIDWTGYEVDGESTRALRLGVGLRLDEVEDDVATIAVDALDPALDLGTGVFCGYYYNRGYPEKQNYVATRSVGADSTYFALSPVRPRVSDSSTEIDESAEPVFHEFTLKPGIVADFLRTVTVDGYDDGESVKRDNVKTISFSESFDVSFDVADDLANVAWRGLPVSSSTQTTAYVAGLTFAAPFFTTATTISDADGNTVSARRVALRIA